ncbi:hypothetical protein DINM_004859 [Dirofilaria immitis]|nr:hypothetical protein [Dirofilaria immitis]
MKVVNYNLREIATSAGTKVALVSTNAIKAATAFRTVLSQSDCKNSISKIHNKKWKKDVVYLYQLNRASSSPNISPFCFKVETWLRASELKYEVEYTYTKLRNNWNFQPWEKYFPFVELNGKRISDSQLILDELKERDVGVARAVDRMIERNTY